jgi:hypothetical protein
MFIRGVTVTVTAGISQDYCSLSVQQLREPETRDARRDSPRQGQAPLHPTRYSPHRPLRFWSVSPIVPLTQKCSDLFQNFHPFQKTYALRFVVLILAGPLRRGKG